MVMTRVVFRSLSSSEIESYLDCGEWQGKAGGYAIQGLAGAFIPEISGSYPNVVGLPIAEVVAALREVGALPQYPLGQR
jgi:septum formation protein